MFHSISPPVQDSTFSSPLLCSSSTPSSSGGSSSDSDESPEASFRYEERQDLNLIKVSRTPISGFQSYKLLAVLSGHVGSVSCLALCGEFILSASQGRDIIVWQQPDLRQFTKFGQGDGSVKALISAGNKKGLFGEVHEASNYVQTRRQHKRLWIEHADSISCLAVSNGLIYSGSWDKTLKVWRLSDFKCLESIKAHDDAINGLVASNGIVYSSSADGKIKAWGKNGKNSMHSLKGILEGHKDISLNSVVVTEDGRLVYGGGSDGFVVGWLANKDVNSWKAVCEVKAHESSVLCMCIMGEFLCSGSADRSICIWKRRSMEGYLGIWLLKGMKGLSSACRLHK
ncbi:UNVERIFIED_CONTAM: protein JINGUBANG [Sesamum angustifolium]|uniref:Protein JINGUBANG n=1 Tax=Sesamum angustifolium TaxID=2727405 RepID=A0AAW2P0G9_9LAMI